MFAERESFFLPFFLSVSAGEGEDYLFSVLHLSWVKKNALGASLFGKDSWESKRDFSLYERIPK